MSASTTPLQAEVATGFFGAEVEGPAAPAEVRREACQKLVSQAVASCRMLRFRDDLSDQEVLQSCHFGLLTAGFTTRVEADWIVMRIAEALGWSPSDRPRWN